MDRIFEKLEAKHPKGSKGVRYYLNWCDRSYNDCRSGKRLPTSKKAVELIKLGKQLGVKIDFNAIYKVLLD
jgi:hypothetical protein